MPNTIVDLQVTSNNSYREDAQIKRFQIDRRIKSAKQYGISNQIKKKESRNNFESTRNKNASEMIQNPTQIPS